MGDLWIRYVVAAWFALVPTAAIVLPGRFFGVACWWRLGLLAFGMAFHWPATFYPQFIPALPARAVLIACVLLALMPRQQNRSESRKMD